MATAFYANNESSGIKCFKHFGQKLRNNKHETLCNTRGTLPFTNN
jgi:hypothetical protein